MRRLALPVLATVLLVGPGSARVVRAQPFDLSRDSLISHRSGQNVQPIFDGWSKTPDGGFEMHFGYLNRNHVEELHIPLGPENSFESGGPDRGQPTYFYPRFNRRVFSVIVPKDFGKRELIWTLTSRGKTERAVGWLQPEWEIDPLPRNAVKVEGNEAPTLSVVSPGRVRPGRVVLTAKASDDGLPLQGKPRRVTSSENPPTFRFDGPSQTTPVNVPEVVRPAAPRIQGLSVSWAVHRGPGAVTFEPAASAVKDGEVTVAATFSKPGEYVLRARATDTSLTTIQDVKVVVADGR